MTWTTHTLERSPDASLAPRAGREWLVTDGAGSYAMGTALGADIRRYHGLLVAAARPPVDRVLALARTIDVLGLPDGSSRPLSTCFFHAGPGSGDEASRRALAAAWGLDSPAPGVITHPEGHRNLVRFTRGLGVVWTYAVGPVTVTRALTLHRFPDPGETGGGFPAVTLTYTIERAADQDQGEGDAPQSALGAGQGWRLEILPLVALRSFHALVGHLEPGALPERYALEHEPGADRLTVRRRGGGGEGERALTLHFPGGRFTPGPDAWHDFFYPLDARRGQGDREDLYTPGPITFTAEAEGEGEAQGGASSGQRGGQDFLPRTFRVTAALGAVPAAALEGPGAWGGAEGRAKALSPIADRLPVPERVRRVFAIAADDFVVEGGKPESRKSERRKSNPENDTSASGSGSADFHPPARATILAGYPWFADWGRDTFIALPGLLRVTGRAATARSIFAAYARVMRRGLVPNYFNDRDPSAAAYNTVDASLWYIHAALDHYHHHTDSRGLAFWEKTLAPACARIIDAYRQGVSPPSAAEGEQAPGAALIRMTDDGLIAAGNAHTNLTWMDAAVGDHPFTPRRGKAVEINALWHHALAGLARALPDALGEARDRCARLAPRAAASFRAAFWNEELGYCHDHVSEDFAPESDGRGAQGWADATIRPNMIFAASLPDAPLSSRRRAKVLGVVREKLLTPMGLRTLAVDDRDYHGRYRGDQPTRDAAYHRGTVWPWLIGAYVEAVLRVGDFSPQAAAEARAALMPLTQVMADGSGRLDDGSGATNTSPPSRPSSPNSDRFGETSERGCLGQLAEIHEAEGLAPRGCPAQGWSVGEVLRAWDLLSRASDEP